MSKFNEVLARNISDVAKGLFDFSQSVVFFFYTIITYLHNYQWFIK